MPLTDFQKEIFQLIKQNRNPDSYVAGGTMVQRFDDSIRYSHDIDFFHDTDVAVSTGFEADTKVLSKEGFSVEVIISQPSFYRAKISKRKDKLLLEWCRDSAFRFFPLVKDPDFGFRLHDIDLATNKCLALANRREARDALDMLYLHEKTFSLAGCVWASCGKDPGFTPDLLFSRIEQNSSLSPDQLVHENLKEKIDPIKFKRDFTNVIMESRQVIKSLDPKNLGCVYMDEKSKIIKNILDVENTSCVKHFGSVKGSWPKTLAL